MASAASPTRPMGRRSRFLVEATEAAGGAWLYASQRMTHHAGERTTKGSRGGLRTGVNLRRLGIALCKRAYA